MPDELIVHAHADNRPCGRKGKRELERAAQEYERHAAALAEALDAVVPNPGRESCWDSTTKARRALAAYRITVPAEHEGGER